ncbi:hypothetical protein ACMZ49_20810 [Alcaligenes phenolicus]|jgi:hypothetical protein
MTLFPEADAWRVGMQDVAKAIEDEMGELVTVTPTRSGGVNFPRIPEPEKALIAKAVFAAKAELVTMGPGRQHGGYNVSPLISTRKPIFQFRYGVLPWPIEQGYRILLHRTRELFEATDVQPDSVSSVVVSVTQLGRAKDDTVDCADDPRVPRNVYP